MHVSLPGNFYRCLFISTIPYITVSLYDNILAWIRVSFGPVLFPMLFISQHYPSSPGHPCDLFTPFLNVDAVCRPTISSLMSILLSPVFPTGNVQAWFVSLVFLQVQFNLVFVRQKQDKTIWSLLYSHYPRMIFTLFPCYSIPGWCYAEKSP